MTHQLAVGKRIKAARVAAGMLQSDLATAANTSQDHVSNLEHGVHSPGLAMLIRLATALNVDAAKLLP